MSNPIDELSGKHLGTVVTIMDQHKGVTASGILFEVHHEADMISMATLMDEGPSYSVGRRSTRVDLGGTGTLTLSPSATFDSEDAPR